MTLHTADSKTEEMEFQDVYELGRLLGTGGFGEVWSCVDRCTRDAAACKIVQKEDLGAEGRQAMEREVSIMGRLKGTSPGIVELKGVHESQDAVQVVMELCSGGDLFDLVQKKGPLPESSARIIFCQLAEALDTCHAHGIIHRDIKPENILLDRPASALYISSIPSAEKHTLVQAKIADFGLSVALKPGETTTGIVGSPFYVAPEVILGKPYGRRVDVWSLGVVLCVMLTRRLPFAGRTSGDTEGLRRAITRGHVNFSLPCWQGVSAEARNLISRMLQVDPQRRIRSHELLAHQWCAAISEPARSRGEKIVTSFSSETSPAVLRAPSVSARPCVSADQASSSAAGAAGAASLMVTRVSLEPGRSDISQEKTPFLGFGYRRRQDREESSGGSIKHTRKGKGLLSFLGLRSPKQLAAQPA